MDDPGSHYSAAEHTHALDAGRLDAFNAGKFAGRTGIEKYVDQIFGHIGNYTIGKKIQFGFNVGINIVTKAFFEGLNGFERCNVPFGLSGRHCFGQLEHALFFCGTG